MNIKLLEGKTAIITGGSSGVGLCMGQLFAEEGANVVLTARRQGPLDEAVKAITDKGGKAIGVVGDVSDPEAVKRAAEIEASVEDQVSKIKDLPLVVKVLADKKEKQEIIAIADVFRAKIVDVSTNSVMIELTGNQNKLDAFLNLMDDFEVIEMVRTGLTGLERGTNIL